ncbi:hypothetical protein SAMN02910317_01695 [Ruminococcaceae bacterium FB2012]|nr:hypothetical protein SAMN02910317_01695 [Ruminococcaceae bacterium FB2012]
MNNIGEICSTSEVHPKGFGGDRKAPELGREHTLGFCSTLRAEQEAGQVPGLRPSFSSSGNGKTLPLVAVSCECRRTPFPGAEYDLSTKKRAGKRLCFPTLLLCSAGVVADAPSGTLSHALLGPAPDPAKGYRALGWAECASRLGLQLCSVPPHHYLFSCTPSLAAELRRPRSGQGHAPAGARYFLNIIAIFSFSPFFASLYPVRMMFLTVSLSAAPWPFTMGSPVPRSTAPPWVL